MGLASWFSQFAAAFRASFSVVGLAETPEANKSRAARKKTADLTATTHEMLLVPVENRED
jgi:hypothetical protein